jgi:tripartite-type tricarboxylate transporter receptor subunit TctC
MNMFKLLLAILPVCVVMNGAVAQVNNKFPERSVKIVVPYPPGGPVDAVMRALASKLQTKWGQPVVIDNRPGANEIIGASSVAQSAPDGYTVFAGTETALTANQFLYSKLPYNPEKDFSPITRVMDIPLAVVVSSAFPAKTLRELIQVAKASPKPLSFATSGVGGVNHLQAVMLTKNEGIELNMVPYKGAAPVINDLLSGVVQMSMVAVSSIEPHVKKGTLRALAVSGESRLPALPDAPTFKEMGMKDVGLVFGVGLVAPAGTPKSTIRQFSNEVTTILRDPEFQKENITPLSYVATPFGPDEYAKFLKENRKLQQERVAASGVKLD